MKRLMCLLFLLMTITMASAQQNDGDTTVTVPKKYVSAEGLSHQSTPAASDNQWVNIGKEVGIATREGLNAVVDTSERFGKTRVGTFIMIMVAWRIMGAQLLGVVLGIPMGLVGILLWYWIARKMFFGYRVLDKVEGSWPKRVKTYKDHEPYHFESDDARCGVGWAVGLGLAAWVVVILCVIF